MHLPQQKNVRASLTAAGISGCWLSLCSYASARLPVPSPLLNLLQLLLFNLLQLLLFNLLQLLLFNLLKLKRLLQNLLQPLSLKSLTLHALSRLNRVLPQPQHLQNNLRRQAQLQQQLSRLQSNPRRQAQLHLASAWEQSAALATLSEQGTVSLPQNNLQNNPHKQAQLQQQLSRLQSNPHRQAQLHLA